MLFSYCDPHMPSCNSSFNFRHLREYLFRCLLANQKRTLELRNSKHIPVELQLMTFYFLIYSRVLLQLWHFLFQPSLKSEAQLDASLDFDDSFFKVSRRFEHQQNLMQTTPWTWWVHMKPYGHKKLSNFSELRNFLSNACYIKLPESSVDISW